jgi:hypothetical protein
MDAQSDAALSGKIGIAKSGNTPHRALKWVFRANGKITTGAIGFIHSIGE